MSFGIKTLQISHATQQITAAPEQNVQAMRIGKTRGHDKNIRPLSKGGMGEADMRKLFLRELVREPLGFKFPNDEETDLK